jgi:hypothetical protein
LLVIIVVKSLEVEAYSFVEDKAILEFEDTFVIVASVQGIVGIEWNMDFVEAYFHMCSLPILVSRDGLKTTDYSIVAKVYDSLSIITRKIIKLCIGVHGHTLWTWFPCSSLRNLIEGFN